MSFRRDTNRESRVELLSESLSCPSVEILTERSRVELLSESLSCPSVEILTESLELNCL